MAFDLNVGLERLPDGLKERWEAAFRAQGVELEIWPTFAPSTWQGGFLPMRLESATGDRALRCGCGMVIDPQFSGSGANDDHPDHDARLGQALIASVYAALAQSPQWKKSLLVVTYDEHGGMYDHVPPPSTENERVRKGCVVSSRFDHTSASARTCWSGPSVWAL